jgi:hypothetical protein
VNLAAAVLATGPIADQVNGVRAAVENKNRFHHDAIFRGIVLTGVPSWVHEIIPAAELEAKKQQLIQKRLAEIPALDAEVVKSLTMKPNTFEIVPIK